MTRCVLGVLGVAGFAGALASAGPNASIDGGVLTGFSEASISSVDGDGFDSDAGNFDFVTMFAASGGTDSGIVTSRGFAMGGAQLDASVINAARGGVSRVVVDAFAEAEVGTTDDGVFDLRQSVGIGGGGNLLAVVVDEDTDFTFSVEVLDANENATSSITFSEGAGGRLLAGETYFIEWQLNAFASLTSAFQRDDVRVRATLLLPSPAGAAGLVAGVLVVARRRR